MLRVALEVPLNDREARTRDLPQNVNRLLVARRRAEIDRSSALEVYARILQSWVTRDENIYLVPINPFLSRAQKQEIVNTLALHEVGIGAEYALRCDSTHRLRGVLQKLDCEELAMFCAPGDPAAQRTLAAVATCSCAGSSHNAPFLRANTRQEGFVFYAPTHVSLEVLGTVRFIAERWFTLVINELRDGG